MTNQLTQDTKRLQEAHRQFIYEAQPIINEIVMIDMRAGVEIIVKDGKIVDSRSTYTPEALAARAELAEAVEYLARTYGLKEGTE